MIEGEDVRIVEFSEAYAKDFADLNYEWIENGYIVEDYDREILESPFDQIIRPGGQVFFALAHGRIAGTVALLNTGEDCFELAKMAVSPDHRGMGISNHLMAACIEYSRAAGKKRIVLESNTKQAAAIKLYRKFGFRETPLDPNSHYIRVNIRMELAIEPVNM